MIKNDNPDVREAASMALANLTTSNEANCVKLVQCNGIDPVVSLLSENQRELSMANAAIILTNLAPNEHFRFQANNAGVVKALIEPLRSSNSFVLSKVALAIGSYLCEAEARAIVCHRVLFFFLQTYLRNVNKSFRIFLNVYYILQI